MVSILILVMTWPTILYVFKTDIFWLPIDSGDIWIEFWNAWYGRLLLTGEAEYFHTDLLFYPEGLSLIYHLFNLLHMLVFGTLQLLIPASNAYNLTYLLIIVSTTLCAYIYLIHIFDNKWIALFGSVVFGFSGYVVGRPMHPGVAFLATVPLALYFLQRAIQERRKRFVLVSSLLIGLTAFISLYIFVCLLLTASAFILYFAISHWKERIFWLNVLLTAAIIATIGVIRVYPMLTNANDMAGVLEKTSGQEKETDLLQFFINYENPVFNRLITNRVTSLIVKLPDPGRWNTSYLGYIPLILIGLGFWRKRYRPCMIPWLILLVFFLLLRLGSMLTINGHVFQGTLLPKYYLDQIVPIVFEAFYSTDHFQIGVLLPLAVLSCYGLLSVMDRVPVNRRRPLILILIAMLAAEYYRTAPGGRVVLDAEVAYLDWLVAENEPDIRLINLPMNRGNSKTYIFHQTLAGFPQVEGLATRTPPRSYAYIDTNYILKTWRGNASTVCTDANLTEFSAALEQLIDDGFSHVVAHHSRAEPDTIQKSYVDLTPVYDDDYVTIFLVTEFRNNCP